MRRWCPIVLALASFGCGREESATPSRVALPAGLQRKGLKADPAPPAPLTRPANRIEETPVGAALAPATRAAAEDGAIEGVCRYAESGTGCWTLDRLPAPRLARQVSSVLQSTSVGGLPFAYGRKNRLLAIVTPPMGKGSQVSVVSEDGVQRMTLTSEAGEPARGNVFLNFPASATTGAVVVETRRRIPQEATVALQEGASMELAGCRLTVDSIVRVQPGDPEIIVTQGRPAWRVVVLRSGTPKHGEEFFPVDPYPMVMDDGRKARGLGGKVEFAPPSVPTVRSFAYSTLPNGAVCAVIDKDPAVAKTLGIGAYELRRAKMENIPLDPR